MADSIYPQNLPEGFDSYLAYVDGWWPTEAAVRAKFPGKPVLTLTVLGGDAVADGCDVESGDLTPVSGAEWVARQLAAGRERPVIYASAYTMAAAVLPGLEAARIARGRVRLLSAHYGSPLGPHICAGNTCGAVPVPMDGTQWSDSAPGVGGTAIDASLLVPGFFGNPPAPTWEEHLMSVIPVIRQGSTNVQAVKNWQGLLVARGYDLGATGPRRDGVDGAWGTVTQDATLAFQRAAGIRQDGIVGPVTYGKALEVS